MNTFLWEIWQVFQPIVTLVVGLVGPIIVGWIGARVISLLKITDDKKKLEIETQIRDSLHKAAENAVNYAIAKKTGGNLVQTTIVDAAMDYVQTKNPDALSKLGVTPENLKEIILSKIGKLEK